MNKSKKKQIDELVNLLNQAHDGVMDALGANRTNEAAEILGECQNAAISIGTAIEESEGEGNEAVTVLEKYCECVYNLNNEILGIGEDGKTAETVNTHRIEKILKKQYYAITSAISAHVSIKKEALFLPYNASMWDSLESVWKELSANPEYETFVVPIPYFDKNPDGSFKEGHYDGDKFPQDVPITYYKDYDIESHHPDRIYIHNPYDEYNYATSIHPAYYSTELRKMTDELIYIPYFVLNEINPDNEEALKGIEHFVTVPAVINATKVIVQSQAMRQAYIKILTRYIEESLVPRKVWEDKIEGSGSPKFKKAMEAAAKDWEELDIPEEWNKHLYKEDGSRKKVIFYNTGLTALLDSEDKMLDKIEDALKVFYENRGEIALLWRPHPLIKATIESIHPELWNRYNSIVEKYREEDWGIYDDSPDMDRAIGICTAYYGDGSSIVQLIQKTGKPIMIQNADVITNG